MTISVRAAAYSLNCHVGAMISHRLYRTFQSLVMHRTASESSVGREVSGNEFHRCAPVKVYKKSRLNRKEILNITIEMREVVFQTVQSCGRLLVRPSMAFMLKDTDNANNVHNGQIGNCRCPHQSVQCSHLSN